MLNKSDPILVTGGTGFLGSYVMENLKSKGYENVLCFSSRYYDLVKQEDTNRLFFGYAPKGVIHLAGVVGGIGANKNNPGVFCYENLMMGANIIENCRKYNVKKLVIAGTICAYPKFTTIPFKEDNLWSGYPEETNAPYGIAKKTLLVMAQGYRQQYGSKFVYVLPVNLYGPRDNFNPQSSHVIPAMILKFHQAKAIGAASVTLWGDGSPTREFLYAEDCADAFVRTLETYDSPDPMNIGAGFEISMKDLADSIKKIVGYTGEIIWDTTMPNGQPRRCLDVSRAQERLGWIATTKLEDGLQKTYEWFVNKEQGSK